ncbi:MAG: alpha/beta fold hydrolase [Bdellovibrionota bacterium]
MIDLVHPQINNTNYSFDPNDSFLDFSASDTLRIQTVSASRRVRDASIPLGMEKFGAAELAKLKASKLPLYPIAKCFDVRILDLPMLPMDEVQHRVKLRQYGNPAGEPIVFLHGLGLPVDITNLRFIDPERFRIILPIQRGNRDTNRPGDLRDNTLAHLINDTSAVFKALALETWHVCGLSYGATIACHYAATEPISCKSLTVINPFIACDEGINLVLEKEYRRSSIRMILF